MCKQENVGVVSIKVCRARQFASEECLEDIEKLSNICKASCGSLAEN